MATFAVVAHRVSPTNTRLGAVLSPAQALTRLGHGDVALGRLDILPSLDGVEPGLWALDRLAARGVTLLNPRRSLVAAHDKLATARALYAARVPHPRTVHVAPWLEPPELELPLVLKPRFGSWGEDVFRCDDEDTLQRALAHLETRAWYEATGAIAQKLVAPRGHDLRLIVAGGSVIGAVRRIAAHGEWRTNVALGARREPVDPPDDARAMAVAAAAAIGGDLVGVDLLPADVGTAGVGLTEPAGSGGAGFAGAGARYVAIEVNGAVDFNGTYSLADDVFAEARRALLERSAPVVVEATA